jgi:hypothetical protein
MRDSSLAIRLLAALRRGLVLLAAISFLLSGMASIHTAHAVSGGHDVAPAKTAGQHDAASHCDQHEQQAPEAKQDKAFSCCASACAPLVMLNQPPLLAVQLRHGEAIVPPLHAAILDRAIAGLFRPPRNLD